MPTAHALEKTNLQPAVLTSKEGLALINGTQAMTAMGLIAYLEAEKLAYQSERIASLTIEGLQGIIDAFDEDIHAARGYQEQMDVAERIRYYLSDSKLTTVQGELRVQDAYSIRCIPQVHGASWQTLAYVKEKLEIEMNAATDNPLIFEDGAKIISGGNFHGQPIAFAMDFLKVAAAELANISERRIERLVNPQLNDLPPFLSPQPGLQSGAMIMQYAAASLVSENKTLAIPPVSIPFLHRQTRRITSAWEPSPQGTPTRSLRIRDGCLPLKPFARCRPWSTGVRNIAPRTQNSSITK